MYLSPFSYGNTLCYSGPGTDGLWFTNDDVRTNNPINSTIFTGRQYDPESQIYYYRARYYVPTMGRFISRDPLGSPVMMASAIQPWGSAEFSQGPNLYWYLQDNATNALDPTGLDRYITQFDILNAGGSGGTQLHIGVAVDTWTCQGSKWVKTGTTTFDFEPNEDTTGLIQNFEALFWQAPGEVLKTSGLSLQAPKTVSSTPCQDKAMLQAMGSQVANPPSYNMFTFNCIWWAVAALNTGMNAQPPCDPCCKN